MSEFSQKLVDPSMVGTVEHEFVYRLAEDAEDLGELVHSLENLICYAADARAVLTAHDPGGAGQPRHRIVSAAMRNEKTGRVVLCVRHRDELFRGALLEGENPRDFEDGFVDNRRQFLTREQAWPVADHAGQILRHCGGGGDRDTLYSENLY